MKIAKLRHLEPDLTAGHFFASYGGAGGGLFAADVGMHWVICDWLRVGGREERFTHLNR